MLAFEVLARAAGKDAMRSAGLVLTLARQSGMPGGICAGQGWESEEKIDMRAYHRSKTAALFIAATEMGAIASGHDAESWHDLGALIGEAFQVADDLRDAVFDAESLPPCDTRAALRGLAKLLAPCSAWRALSASKPALGIYTSPRTSSCAGQPSPERRSGILRTVRTFCVTSSPCSPSPRVARGVLDREAGALREADEENPLPRDAVGFQLEHRALDLGVGQVVVAHLKQVGGDVDAVFATGAQIFIYADFHGFLLMG